MAFINYHTTMTTKTELDIFATPPTQTSVESGSIQSFRPISSLSDDSPIEFLIPGHGDEYIDLAHTTLHLLVKIIQEKKVASASDKETSDSSNTGPINNWMHSIFQQVIISLNQKCITPPSNCYSYRSYIENLLNYGSDAKTSHLTSGMWYKDTAKNMDAVDDTNEGYTKRSKLTSNEKIVELYGKLHCDFFNQDKYLINGVEMNVRLVKSPDNFHLMGGNGKLQIIDATLYVRKIKINPSILIAHARALSASTAKYPITRVDIKTVTIPKDIQNKSLDNIYLGQLPKRCIIGLVKSKAFNGDTNLNPYNFYHFNQNFLSLYMDSVQIPSKPLTPNYAKNQYTRSYHTLFSGSGIHFSDHGNCISLEDYPNGYCLAAFDLTPDLSSHEPHWNIIRSGSLRLEIRFEKPLPETITAIIFSEFDNIIEIDKNRNIILDYSS